MHSGIYEIVNMVNGNRYIGSAVDFSSRWTVHVSALRRGAHHSVYLQRAWGKQRAEDFQFRKLLVCSRQDLLLYEQLAIDALAPEYNMCDVAGSRLGVKHGQPALELIRQRSLRMWKEDRANMLVALSGSWAKIKTLRKDPDWCEQVARRVRVGRQVNAKTLTYNGVTKPLREWADEYHIPDSTFHARLNAGWAAERALTTPVFAVNSKAFFDARRETRGHPVYQYKGQTMGLVELAKALGTEKGPLWTMLRKRSLEDTIAYYEAVAEGARPKTLRNVVCEYNGKEQSLLTLCEELGAPYPTLSRRVKRYGLEETIKYYEQKRA